MFARRSSSHVRILLSLSLLICILTGKDIDAQSSWTRLQDFPGTSMKEALSFGIGATGFYGNTQTQELWRFDAINSTWTRLNDMPNIGYQSPVFVIGTSAYVISVNQLWRYATATDSWTQLQDVPDNSWRAGYAFAIGEKGYVGSGFFNGQDFYGYDSSSDTWSQLGSIPASDVVGGITFVVDSHGFVEGTNVPHTYEYAPEADSWDARPDVDATYGTAYVAAGIPYIYNTQGQVIQFNNATGTWRVISQHPGTVVCYAAGFSYGFKIYIVTGEEFAAPNCGPVVSSEVWSFDTNLVFFSGFD